MPSDEAMTDLLRGAPQPPASLEDKVVQAVIAAARGTDPIVTVAGPRRRGPVLMAAAAALVACLGVTAVLLIRPTAPPTHQLVLIATADAPGATGSVVAVERGDRTRVELSTLGLPSGEYQMWVTTVDGHRVMSEVFRPEPGPQVWDMAFAWRDWAGCGVSRVDGLAVLTLVSGYN